MLGWAKVMCPPSSPPRGQEGRVFSLGLPEWTDGETNLVKTAYELLANATKLSLSSDSRM